MSVLRRRWLRADGAPLPTRADRHAAVLLASTRPVIAMLEQMRRDYHARGIDSDRWRRSDRLLASHQPIEGRIQALTRTSQ
ncbi:MAG: hypothetical protein ACLP50_00170 [Solirubrobacteraceae bacterium]